MWVEEKGTSADPADTSAVCGCGKRLSLQEAFIPGRLGKCRGERPWLLDRDPDGCDQNLKLLTRTATNTYFPQVLTIISLPSEEDELTKMVAELSGELTSVQSIEHVAMAKQFNARIAASLGPFSDQDIFERLKRIREGARTDAARSPKVAEFDVFASGREEIGQNHPNAKLYAQTLKRDVWTANTPDIDLSSVKSLVAVHRLREVSCLYGLTDKPIAIAAHDHRYLDDDKKLQYQLGYLFQLCEPCLYFSAPLIVGGGRNSQECFARTDSDVRTPRHRFDVCL
jgi:hypothetical protein